MPKIKLEHVVSCSSEDSVHVASNLLNNDTSKKWKSKECGESSVTVIFQLEKACKISGIDIGNENSSFVEVLVGRSSSQESDYQIILAMSSFMTPMEARNLTNSNRVRLFTSKDLITPACEEKWDRVKVVCTQPFNKRVQFGLSFITLQTSQEAKPDDPGAPMSLGKFTIRPESPNFLTAGSLFARRKELAGQSETKSVTVAQEIKNNLGTPRCKPISIRTPSNNSTCKPDDTSQKNRNRTDLFYESDDEEANEKIDRVVEKARKDEEKRKEAATSVKSPRNRKPNGKKNSVDDGKEDKKTKTAASPTTSVNSKRKLDTIAVKTANKKIKLTTKPFCELLSGVVFTISGIMNPDRANLRTLALSMGAKYKPDWDNSCTHLICAFANTPKFQQVQGKGKIITKSWVQDCHAQRKRLPWRRYALDRNDQGVAESEDEICEQQIEITKNKTDAKSSRNANYQQESGSDTEDEIERILARERTNESNNNKASDKGKDEDAFNVDTDEEHFEKNTKIVTEIVPKIFTTEIFYIDDVFSDSERSNLERLVKAFNGTVLSRISNILDFIITTRESADGLRDRCTTAKLVTAQWIYECQEQQTCVPYEKYVVV
ncbi:XRCC1 [Carabus blaptoides fortunei]